MSDPVTPLVIEPLGPARYKVTRDDRTQVAYAVTHGRKTWVWLDGHAYHLPDDDDSEGPRAQADEFALSAPMPATVRAIRVTVGQRVAPGDVLIVLEAMKMELAIKASTAGLVRALHCAPGEMVRPGLPLVEIA